MVGGSPKGHNTYTDPWYNCGIEISWSREKGCQWGAGGMSKKASWELIMKKKKKSLRNTII